MKVCGVVRATTCLTRGCLTRGGRGRQREDCHSGRQRHRGTHQATAWVKKATFERPSCFRGCFQQHQGFLCVLGGLCVERDSWFFVPAWQAIDASLRWPARRSAQPVRLVTHCSFRREELLWCCSEAAHEQAV